MEKTLENRFQTLIEEIADEVMYNESFWLIDYYAITQFYCEEKAYKQIQSIIKLENKTGKDAKRIFIKKHYNDLYNFILKVENFIKIKAKERRSDNFEIGILSTEEENLINAAAEELRFSGIAYITNPYSIAQLYIEEVINDDLSNLSEEEFFNQYYDDLYDFVLNLENEIAKL